MIGDAVDKHRVAHQTAGQLEPRFSLLTKLLIHPSLSIFARTERHPPPALFPPFFTHSSIILERGTLFSIMMVLSASVCADGGAES